MTKQYKLIVAIHHDPTVRDKILKRLVIEKGFALTPTDAAKLIKPNIGDIDLNRAYFVIADNFKFKDSPITQHRLYQLAARGIAVILGTKRLPREMEFMCEAYYE